VTPARLAAQKNKTANNQKGMSQEKSSGKGKQ
jgi:hypothetical protein